MTERPEESETAHRANDIRWGNGEKAGECRGTRRDPQISDAEGLGWMLSAAVSGPGVPAATRAGPR